MPGIYDAIMGKEQPLPDGTLPTATLPTLTPDLYAQLWPMLDGAANSVGTMPSTLPMSSNGEPATGTIGSGRFAGKPLPLGEATGKADTIIKAAQALIGTPYVWGGTSGHGVDCSGLVQLAYKAAGIALPRVSSQQANQGQKVSLSKLRPGDLVAWNNSSRNVGADHIAVYIGGGRIIEAARPGTDVRVRQLEPGGFDSSAWGVRILGGQ